jgi:hypothetical protein
MAEDPELVKEFALEDDSNVLLINAVSRFEVVLEVMVVAVDAIIKGSPFNRNCNIDTKNP